jgi:tetraacyldisaccharide 4'-kinase
MNEAEANRIKQELKPLPNQSVFFTSIRYGEPYHIVTRANRVMHKKMEVLLVCGIANPEPLKKYLLEEVNTYEACYYSDHHIFTIDDLREIRQRFETMDAEEKIIITTEKDAVRLVKFGDELRDIPFYVLPIAVSFLFSDARRFNDLVVHFIQTFNQGQPTPAQRKS